MIRLGVLCSGSGTNLQAILDACAARRIDAEVAVVIGNVPGARALERARAAGVAAELVPSKGVADRAAYDAQVAERLRHHRVDLVCLAGFMRILCDWACRHSPLGAGSQSGAGGCRRGRRARCAAPRASVSL